MIHEEAGNSLKIFQLDRGEACSNYSSDAADWDHSAYFINLDCVTCLEERRYEHTNSTSWFVWFSGNRELALTKAAFERNAG